MLPNPKSLVVIELLTFQLFFFQSLNFPANNKCAQFSFEDICGADNSYGLRPDTLDCIRFLTGFRIRTDEYLQEAVCGDIDQTVEGEPAQAQSADEEDEVEPAERREDDATLQQQQNDEGDIVGEIQEAPLEEDFIPVPPEHFRLNTIEDMSSPNEAPTDKTNKWSIKNISSCFWCKTPSVKY
jgi:hypothetical protein